MGSGGSKGRTHSLAGRIDRVDEHTSCPAESPAFLPALHRVATGVSLSIDITLISESTDKIEQTVNKLVLKQEADLLERLRYLTFRHPELRRMW